ncbi:agmatinase [Anaerolineae bacterium CFX7]|nr:agmatinase [Anaerolineae bacterium CFX7]
MNYPLDAQITPRFAGSPTFFRLPQQAALDGLDVAIMGIPFDNAASFRPGARFGPRAVREMSSLLRPYNRVLDVDPYKILNCADVGDCPVNPFNTLESLDLMAKRYHEILKAGVTPISYGGDHLVALGELRGIVQARGGPVAVLQVDAHLDTWDTYFGNKYTHGSFMRRAIEEGLVDVAHTLQVGIRGPLFSERDMDDVRALGIEILPMDAIVDFTVAQIAAAIHARVDRAPVFLTFDVDGVDPAFTPGTGTPEIGGFTSQQMIALLHRLRGLNLVGADIVEVAPAYDNAGITALFAARVGYEVLGLLALQRQAS